VGVHHFVAIDGEWADDPDALAAALRADWPGMVITPASGAMAYDIHYGQELGTIHADGRAISFKHAEDLVERLAVWWRARIPDAVKLAVFDDADATPRYL
jgi:hypothetical protein